MENDEDDSFTMQFGRLPRVQFGVKTANSSYLPPHPSKLGASTQINDTDQQLPHPSAKVAPEDALFSKVTAEVPVLAEPSESRVEGNGTSTKGFSFEGKIETAGVLGTGVVLLGLLAHAAAVTENRDFTLAIVALAGVFASSAANLYVLNYSLSRIAVLAHLCAGVAGPIAAAVGLYLTAKLDLALLLILAVPLCVSLWMLLLKMLKLGLSKFYSKSKTSIVLAGFCVCGPLCVQGLPLYFWLTQKDDGLFGIACALAVGFIGLLSVLWLYMHAKLFRDAVLASYSILGAMIFCEVFALSLALSALQDNVVPREAVWLSLCFIPIVPAFTLLGLLLSAALLKDSDKLMIFQACGYLALLASFLYYESSVLGTFLLVAPPCAAVYWSGLSLCSASSKFKALLSLLCVSVVTPLGFLVPYYTADFISSYVFWPIFCGVLLSGVVLPASLPLARSLCTTSCKRVKDQMKKLSHVKVAMWVSVCCLSIGGLVLSLTYNSDVEMSGVCAGLFALLPVVYLATDYLMKLHFSTYDFSDYTQALIDQNITVLKSNAEGAKRKIQIKAIVMASVVEVLMVVWMALDTSNTSSFAGVLIFACGMAVVCTCFVLGLEIKLRLGPFGDYSTSGCVGICWLTLVFPLFVLIPCVLVREPDDSWVIPMASVAGFLLLVGIFAFIMGLRYVKKDFDFESKARATVLKLKRALKDIAVRADIKLLRHIYDQYLQLGPLELKQLLVSGTNYYWWKVPESDPDLRYSKVLVPYELYQKLLKYGNTALWMPDFRVKAKSKSCWEALGCFEVEEVIEPLKIEDQMMSREIVIEQEDSLQGVSLSQMEVKDLSFSKSPVLSLEGVQFLQSSYPDLEGIEAKSLSEYDLEIISKSDMCERLRREPALRRKWLLYVFDTFARGDFERFKVRWITQDNISQLVRLSGLHLTNAYLEDLYNDMTHRLEPDGRLTFRLITFQVFLHEVVPAIARHVFLDGVEVETRLVVDVMYPHISSNIPNLGQSVGRPPSPEKPSSEEDPLAEATTNRPGSQLSPKKSKVSKSCCSCCFSSKLLVQSLDISDELETGLTTRKQSPSWEEIISTVVKTLELY